MELRFQAGGPESWSADAVIVFLSEDEKLEKAYPELLDAAPWMSIAPGMRDFHGKKGEMGLLYGPPAHPLSRAVVVGLGKLGARVARVGQAFGMKVAAWSQNLTEERAAEIGADAILLAKNIDGVYSADPKKDPDAVRYESLSYHDVLAQDLQVMGDRRTGEGGDLG